MSSLRSVLRAETAESHARLDARVGTLASRELYTRYLRSLHAFRTATEAALLGHAAPPASGGWLPRPIARELAMDLADLGAPTQPPLQMQEGVRDLAWWVGTTYVLAGSTVGARILYRRALALGLRADFGARHLARQNDDDWPQFLSLAERLDGHVDVEKAAQAANDCFACAEQAFQD